MTSSLTVGRVLDAARVRHPAFYDVGAEGSLVTALDARQRSLILQYGGAVDGLMSTSASIATNVTGSLLGVDSDGNPYFISTTGDGWSVQQDSDGFLFIDTSGPLINSDPFGENGGNPGFPLPADFLKLIAVSLVYNDNTQRPVNVVHETARFERQRGGWSPTAFLSGNRIVPLRALSSGNSSDMWSQPITSVELSYIALPVLQAMTDPVNLPAMLAEALIASAAVQLAFHARAITAAERQKFINDEATAVASLTMNSADIIVGVVPTGVQYRR